MIENFNSWLRSFQVYRVVTCGGPSSEEEKQHYVKHRARWPRNRPLETFPRSIKSRQNSSGLERRRHAVLGAPCRHDVLERLRGRFAIRDEVRRWALLLANGCIDGPQFDAACWAVVRRADAATDRYLHALGTEGPSAGP
jgi:hypothetical protein